MILFNGKELAAQRQEQLKTSVVQLGKKVVIASLLFTEDAGSVFYAAHKQKAAASVGIEYQLFPFSLTAPRQTIHETIRQLNTDQRVVGIIVQKPTKRTWLQTWEKQVESSEVPDFASWWTEVYSGVDPRKDVDGLHPVTLAAIADGTWREKGCVLPATCQAVVDILEFHRRGTHLGVPQRQPRDLGKFLIIGRSDLLGVPLAHVLRQQGCDVELLGRQGFEARAASGIFLKDAGVVVSAVGSPRFITSQMVSPGVVLIDGGEPQPDIDLTGMDDIASFATPVPGGVGPLTVVCLLESSVRLAQNYVI